MEEDDVYLFINSLDCDHLLNSCFDLKAFCAQVSNHVDGGALELSSLVSCRQPNFNTCHLLLADVERV